jgi:hypothetical protein
MVTHAVIPAMQETKGSGIIVQASYEQDCETPLKNNKSKMSRSMAQVIACLSSKHKVLIKDQ